MEESKAESAVHGDFVFWLVVGFAFNEDFFMKWIFLVTIFCLSCGSDPVSQPFVAQSLKEGGVQKIDPVSEKREEPEVGEVKKILAGKLTFKDLSKDELAAFRVIPEKGQKLIRPKNKRYEQVDGFWWEGVKGNVWFKIPDSSEVWIGKGEAPLRFKNSVERGGLKVYTRSNGFVKLVGALKNGIKRPDWVENSGRTMSPVPSPWAKGEEVR